VETKTTAWNGERKMKGRVLGIGINANAANRENIIIIW